MGERFFILGCQRTGTTLLRLILEAHPDVFCFDELKGYAVLQNSLVEDAPPARMIGFKLPRWTEQLTLPELFDDPVGPCANFYRGEKILFLHRDVRDTIASMLKLGGPGSSWCETWVPRTVEAKLAHDDTFRARYSAELDMIESCDRSLIGLAALYWRYKTDSFFLYRNLGLPVLAVPYERLVLDPRPTLQVVCAHLGIPFHEHLMRHGELQHTELLANGLAVGKTDPTKPIHSDSVGQWVTFLSEQEAELAVRISGDVSARIAAFSRSDFSPAR